MKAFRLYVGVEKEALAKIASLYLEGFTVFSSLGYWNGVLEESTCLEYIAENIEENIRKVYTLQSRIKAEFNQYAVRSKMQKPLNIALRGFCIWQF